MPSLQMSRCRHGSGCRCTGYIEMLGTCACSHSEQDHAVIEVPALPPRRCSDSAAQQFVTNDSSADPRATCLLCSSPYYEHLPLAPLNQEPSTPSFFSSCRLSTSTSANLSLPSLSTPVAFPNPMHGYLQPPASPLASVSTNTGLLLAPANMSATGTGWPAASLTPWSPPGPPMHGTVHTEYEQLFREMRAPIPQKIGSFILQARNLGLVFQIEGNFQKDNAAGSSFHHYLCSHFETASLAFSGSSSPSSSTGQLTPTSQFPWSFMMTGKGQCSARGAKLLPSRSSPEHVTHRDLQKNGSRLPVPSAPYHEYQLVFIFPLWDIIAGPVNGHGMHCCLAPRMWNGHYESSLHEDLEEINCSSLCITDSEELPDGSLLLANTDVPAADQTGQSSLLDALLAASASLPSLSNSPLLPAAGASEPSSIPASIPSSALTSPISSTFSASSPLTSSPSTSSPLTSSPLTSSPLTSPPSTSSPSASSSSVSVVAAHQSPRAALHAWRTSLGHDLDSSRVAAGLQNRVIDITAPSAMLAAQGFLAVCKAFCQVGTSDEPVLPEDVEITDCTPLNMVIGSITANIGHGVGNGPMRTFWGALITLITQYSGHWQLVSDTGYYVPTVTSLPPSDDDIISFRAYSIIICTGFILEMELLPISPHVLVYLLDAYQTSVAQPFLDVMSPLTSHRLHSWPPPVITNPSTGRRELDVAFACDPYTMILEVDGTVQISQLRQLSEAAQESLGQRLVCHMIYGNETPLAHGLHAVYAALESAFNHVIHDDMKFRDYFHINGPGSAQSIIQGMFAGRTLTSPQQVINLISYRPIEQRSIHLRMGYIPDLDYATLAEQFMAHLKCYLHGCGAPHASDGSILFEEPSHSDDTLLRSRLFLCSSTAHEYLPINPTQTINIKFDLHTCFYTLDVLLNETTANIINQSIPDNDSATDFDRWIHSVISGNSSDSYNQI
ncbi:uncharacterized protein EDB91DRAFT_1281564 [Suillus paluster]|uniref:uncharacterized protein n=1 Tax=Suillus paluster TaxID=48578 RepID=UPI001B882AA1|nr:uncharacterized protein EDB91DRAFT_1281564 [Suillus paluster]KAG1740811.1 hypothetical protein EDB91DRAFT_1281564 [Suillus paluster]